MVGVVLMSRKLRINPDNVATPIAASLGDLTTLSLLAGVSTLLYEAIGTTTSHHRKVKQVILENVDIQNKHRICIVRNLPLYKGR